MLIISAIPVAGGGVVIPVIAIIADTYRPVDVIAVTVAFSAAVYVAVQRRVIPYGLRVTPAGNIVDIGPVTVVGQIAVEPAVCVVACPCVPLVAFTLSCIEVGVWAV